MVSKFLDFFSKQKTFLFLIMCLFVHAFNIAFFYILGLFPFAVLNSFSTLFYAAVLLLFKKNNDAYIIFTYFEIISFSFVSELFAGGSLCYIFYVIGMISVVFYLLPPKKRMKHIFQGIGIAYAIAIYYVYLKKICIFPEYAPLVQKYAGQIGFLNLCITLFTLFYISNLYIFELNTASDKLNYFSNHDLLTGLFNRRFFEHIMQRNKTENENEYTIAIFDIDDYKKVNDTYGHQAGDAVLRVVSGLIEKTAGNEYVCVRWGGEEFILYMPQTRGEKAYELLDALRVRIGTTFIEVDDQKIRVTVTVGMCSASDLTDYENIIRKADEKLYYGKRNGKNQVVK
ncbi:MAG: GGDEF domain-containing protein [Treponema sp.]|nr:GGDEF domain-containing protein [Treponema sp.]